MGPSLQLEVLFVVTIAGDATEVIAAGNFMDGAITSFTVYLFNHLAHSTSRTAREQRCLIRQLKRLLKYGQQNGGNLYTEHSNSFYDTQHDYMLAKGVGAKATFYVRGGYSVYEGAYGYWYITVAASGHTMNSGTVEFKGGLTMTVDGEVTQQLPLIVNPGPRLRDPDFAHFNPDYALE